MAVSPDGRFIVSGSGDRTVKVWEAETGNPLRSLEGHTGLVYAVAVSPDGRTLLSRFKRQNPARLGPGKRSISPALLERRLSAFPGALPRWPHPGLRR